MIQITPHMRILVAIDAVDFRSGIDKLAQLCREVIGSDPFSGHVFVFRNRRKTSIRIFTYDGQGFWLCTKRLSKGRFRWWPEDSHAGASRLDAHELQLLIWSGNPLGAQVAPSWKKILV